MAHVYHELFTDKTIVLFSDLENDARVFFKSQTRVCAFCPRGTCSGTNQQASGQNLSLSPEMESPANCVD